jgi:hypothetical protein
MSSVEIDRLVAERSLLSESFSDAQLAVYWAKAAESFANSQAAGLSTSGSLHGAYMTALRTIVTSLAVHGLRVNVNADTDDHIAFHAAENLGDAMGRHAAKLDAVRLAGDWLMDGPEHNEAVLTERLGHAFDTLREVLPVIRLEILAARPALASLLPLTDS